jgi:hypothetical protein
MYTLRFPFRLPPDRKIEITETNSDLDSLTLSLEKQDTFYVLTIKGFPTEDRAKHYINNVWAGLMWVLLHQELSPEAIIEPREVIYTEDPCQAAKNFGFKDPVDGLIDGGSPAVYPTEKRLLTATGGQVSVLVTTHEHDVLRFFREGTLFPESDKVIADLKLRVAFELYGAYFTEFSGNAKFLTLVMALETLATGIPRTKLIRDLLDKWKKDVTELKDRIEPESDDADSLEAVSRELLFRKEDSIRRQIRNVVFTTLQVNGDEDAAEMGKRAVEVYDHRSTLVHEGKLEPPVLGKATTDAKTIVQRVLRARFVQKAGPCGESNI